MPGAKKTVSVYLALTFLLTWGLVWLGVAKGWTGNAKLFPILLTACMFCPAAGSILTRVFCNMGFTNMALRPYLRGHAGSYAVALLLPTMLTVLGGALYFLFFPAMFDPSMTATRLQLAVYGDRAEWMLAVQLIAAVLFGGFINLIPAMGEELGWRGFLLPQLMRLFSPRKAALLTGVIWGVWHAPMIALGHNYGLGYAGAPWTGVLLFTVYGTAMGVILSRLTVKTGSAWTAALAHGALNACASLPLLWCFSGYEPLVGPLPMGALSMAPTLLAGALCLILPWGASRTRGAAEGDA